MDDTTELIIVVASAMVVLGALAITLLAIILMYHKRKMQHVRELDTLKREHERHLLLVQVEVQQGTMQTIGREIHDDVGQKLVYARVLTQQLKPDDDESVSKVNTIIQTIDNSIQAIRKVSSRLEDGEMKSDLIELIEMECQQLRKANIQVNFTRTLPSIKESQKARSVVYRIIQEFIQNSLKHAQCSQISINVLAGDRQNVLITICDNGKGFDLKNVTLSKGNGIRNMNTRAGILEANLDLASSAEGTSMTLSIPVSTLTNI